LEVKVTRAVPTKQIVCSQAACWQKEGLLQVNAFTTKRDANRAKEERRMFSIVELNQHDDQRDRTTEGQEQCVAV
jgi:hypothetical protein